MKKIKLFLSITIIIFIAACSDDEVTPNDRFDMYVNHWNELEFTEMYDMLTQDASEFYPTDQFIDRYKKIYEDLNISKLNVSYTKLSEEEVETALEEGRATIPFDVEMESLAGPIAFNYEATLVQQGEEEDKNWFIEWNPGFIFPEIEDGGEIGIQSTQPSRGEILDRNLMPLAINDVVWNIGIVPEKLGANPEQNKKKIAQLLNMSVDSIDKELNAGWVEPHLFVPLKKIQKTNEALLDQLWEIEGVQGSEATGRVYPLGEAAAHLVGYVGKITGEELENVDADKYTANDYIGKRGLEQLYEERLKGEPGVEIYVKQEDGDSVVLAESEVKDGENIILTIDSNIQEKIFESYEDDAGTAAAIHPKTGETLALVSSPAFDPNDLLYGISQSKWDELQNNPQSPLINRFAATFAPGSALKPISAAIGLKNGTIVPGEGIEIKGETWSNGEGWGDYEVRRVSESSGPVDIADALIRSDNIYFAMKAVEMGSEAYTNGLETFGFGESLPFEYPITASNISASGTLDGEVLLANTSYGQGEIELSSLHLALAFTPFLNNGNMIKPTLLEAEETGQVWVDDILSSEHAELMQEILRDVVTKGSTAIKARKADFPISGKTGTAELKLAADESGEENGWFVGYPTDDQDILIAMMIEKTEDKGGSSYTVGKVTEILEAIK